MDFAKEFNWTPNQVRELPYRWVQMYYLVRSVKAHSMHMQAETDKKIKEFKDMAKPKHKRR